MHAVAGDQIVIRSASLDEPPRRGVIRQVLGSGETEHFQVQWDDGHESLFYPGPDAMILPAQVRREPVPEQRAKPSEELVPTAPQIDDPVERIMSTPVTTVDAEDSLRVTAVTLADAEVGALVVVSGTTPIGIVSERDIIHALAAGGDPDQVTASAVTGVSTVWASPSDTIRHVAELMRDADIRHVPIRVQDALVGIVSMRDVHKVLLA
ncbi:MAG TPA: CBS domain-containing protein [Actinopolymorphaceae bacterium]|jgi:CBS domain-containing protein